MSKYICKIADGKNFQANIKWRIVKKYKSYMMAGYTV